MPDPETIGERFAEDRWPRLGSLLIRRRQTYLQAIESLERICADPIARQAFDRRLGRLAADTPGTIAQPPKRRRRS